jgi:uncharacterized protein involved in exopolysaccharide biosynthesis
MLDTLKPDPVTGEVISGASTRGYVATQTQLITDYTVAGKVAEQIGWLSEPTLIASYNKRPKSDQRDFKRWLADMVILNTKASVLEGSNILEIKYTGTTPDGAKKVVDALRNAYITAALDYRHQDAENNAAWYADQMAKTKQALDQAIAAETQFEKDNGIVMQENKLDAESARLQALTQQGAPLAPPMMPAAETSPAAIQLAEIDAQLSVAQKTLGPNNPDIQALQSKRALLQSLVERDRALAKTAAARMASGGVAALDKAVEEQKAKVIGQSQQLGRLNVLHQDVELKRAQYEHVAAKTAQYREEAASADVGLTPLGTAATPKAPTFPNYWLIVPGSIVLGLGVGVLVSLLLELFGRRVRSPDDLAALADIPLVCVVPGPDGRARPRLMDRLGRLNWRPRSPGAVEA